MLKITFFKKVFLCCAVILSVMTASHKGDNWSENQDQLVKIILNIIVHISKILVHDGTS